MTYVLMNTIAKDRAKQRSRSGKRIQDFEATAYRDANKTKRLDDEPPYNKLGYLILRVIVVLLIVGAHFGTDRSLCVAG